MLFLLDRRIWPFRYRTAPAPPGYTWLVSARIHGPFMVGDMFLVPESSADGWSS
jgi:hypothetical protein